MSTQINFKKGSVEMLLLHVLSCKGDCYGYQLSQLIKKSSENTLDFPVGSLYPALYKMIDNGYISDIRWSIQWSEENLYTVFLFCDRPLYTNPHNICNPFVAPPFAELFCIFENFWNLFISFSANISTFIQILTHNFVMSIINSKKLLLFL